MGAAYATVDEYRLATGDAKSSDERVEYLIGEESAELRAAAGIAESGTLTDDQLKMCRKLVVGAVKSALVSPWPEEMGDIGGAKQASFSANGFQQTVTLGVSSQTAYFDRAVLKALKRSLRGSQLAFTLGVG